MNYDMRLNKVKAEILKYDEHAEVEDCGVFPLVIGFERKQFDVYEDYICYNVGCYDQQCDVIAPATISDVMNAMDAAAKAFNESLQVAISEKEQ